MAYFIVIGTNNDVKCVVDEIKNAHLQHNVITSGCVLFDEQNTYYHWDVFNAKGDKTNEKRESFALHDAMTNQISQFKTLIPQDAIPNVFIVSNCFDEKECETLKMVSEELCEIGGAMQIGLQVDIVLLGYDINKPEDVTLRPHWRVLELLRGLGATNRFHTNILYINNMDYKGAATNIDSCVLGRFLCHWSKMVCSGGYDPKSTIYSNVYSIGLSEQQYDFRDLNDFFKLSAEERLLDRTLNNDPSDDTKELLHYNYYKRIDLELPWIDGLCNIKKLWEEYCSTKWNPKARLSEQNYSVARQEQEIVSYLNLFLKLYIAEEEREVAELSEEIEKKEAEIALLTASAIAGNVIDETIIDSNGVESVTPVRVIKLGAEIEDCKLKIKEHQDNIERNTFLDANEFYENYSCTECITEEDETQYKFNYDKVLKLIAYVKSDSGISVMRDAISRANVTDTLPQPNPAATVFNVGCLEPRELSPDQETTIPTHDEPVMITADLSERSGCFMWFKGLFSKKKDADALETIPNTVAPNDDTNISDEASKFLKDSLNKSVAALRKVDDIRCWWNKLCDMVEKYQTRQKECELLMDGELDLTGKYVKGKEGYTPKNHVKSVSLIDMNKVRYFRDNDGYFKENIDKFLMRWFNKDVETENRLTIPELINHQILDPLVGRYHTLKWDGSNPFVKEELTDTELQEYIDYDLKQSTPFVEYVRIQESNLVSNLNTTFFSNNHNIPTEADVFRNKYKVSSNSITPVYLKDFVNSLCVVQVMDIPEHIDSLKDYKPTREYRLSRLQIDISNEVAEIVAGAITTEEKARAIYNWLCENIKYDTTKQIHDAETCWTTRRGVCQAYCELFCYMAEAVGVTADVIVGKTKNPEGIISDVKHAWVYVYTHAYDGMLIDPTWGAGGIDGVKFVKNEDNSIWYNISPYWMAFSHFPDQQYWTKLEIQITEEQFQKIPYQNPSKENDGKDLLFECLSR